MSSVLTSHSTQNRSFQRRSSQPIDKHRTEKTEHNKSRHAPINRNIL